MCESQPLVSRNTDRVPNIFIDISEEEFEKLFEPQGDTKAERGLRTQRKLAQYVANFH
jgi:hypothetical protein